MNKFILTTAALSVIGACAAPLAFAATPAHYTVQERFQLGGQGKWDYAAVDASHARLYLSRGDHVQVLQLPAGKPVADIPDTPGVHGFAFAPDLQLGFISVGRADSVVVFDLDTMQPRQTIKVGNNPDAILYDPQSHKVFAFNGKSHDVSVI